MGMKLLLSHPLTSTQSAYEFHAIWMKILELGSLDVKTNFVKNFGELE